MASILDLVKHYQHAIEKHPNDEQKILKCIDKLFNLGVTVQHLQETGVGRTVNALRKEPGDVGQAARALVNKWKLMVAAEESDHDDEQPQSATYNGYDNGKTPEDSDYDGKVKTNQYDKFSKNNTEEENYPQHMNGNYSGKRKYQSSEDEEPVKKSRNVTYNEVQKNKLDIQVKKEQSETEHDSHSTSSHSEGSDSEESGSYEEDKYSKQTSRIKNSDKHQSSSTKYSSGDSQGNHKKSSSSSRKPHEHGERHSKHSHVESRNTSEKSSKDKSSSSNKHKNDKESSKKEKFEHISPDKEKKRSEVKESSTDRHRSSSEKHKSSSNSEKNKSNPEKSSNKSEKHSSSQKQHKSEKEKHKHSSERSSDKHKSKEHSSKDKHSSSSKEKVKDKNSSSKDKENSDKSDKKHYSSSDVSVKENRSKSEKDDRKRSSSSSSKEKKAHSSSHSSKSSKSSSSKTKDVPKKKQKKDNGENEDGIDCGSGASFAEALGMISPSKPKKKSSLIKETSHSPNNSSSHEDLSPAALLAPTAKLAPLPALEISALPEISPNYKPRPPPRFLPHFTDEDAISAGISSKNQRTKVYSGNKVLGKIPTLYEMCVLILQEHIDALEYTGGVPYEILKPVVDKATPQQLYMLEHFNPYLMEDTDHLWQKFCEKNFRNKKREELESWREMYIRCQEEQEHRLKSLTANIKIAQEAKKAPVKQTKMAYVDSVVKPPRNIARKQAQHGTAFAAAASPAARVAALAAAPNVLKGNARPSPASTPCATTSSLQKPKKAPLMQKALQFMRGRKR